MQSKGGVHCLAKKETARPGKQFNLPLVDSSRGERASRRDMMKLFDDLLRIQKLTQPSGFSFHAWMHSSIVIAYRLLQNWQLIVTSFFSRTMSIRSS